MLTAQPSSSIPGDGTREGLNSEDITQSGAQKSPSPSATLSNLEINATPSTANAKTSNEVASTNNRVLARVCQHLKHFTTYGPAIDEFYNWCRDPRAYHPLNEQAILQCLQVCFYAIHCYNSQQCHYLIVIFIDYQKQSTWMWNVVSPTGIWRCNET